MLEAAAPGEVRALALAWPYVVALVDLRAREPSVPVAHAAATPIGLSIEGRRVVWGENVGGRGRIRALTVRQR